MTDAQRVEIEKQVLIINAARAKYVAAAQAEEDARSLAHAAADEARDAEVRLYKVASYLLSEPARISPIHWRSDAPLRVLVKARMVNWLRERLKEWRNLTR